MPLIDENVCLKVQRAGITNIFRLRGSVIKFGYAPGGEHALILHDSLLEDVHGVIERQDKPKEFDEQQPSKREDLTAYRLRARSSGIEVDGVSLPPREAVSIWLKYGQKIKVGRYYLLTVEREQVSLPTSTKSIEGMTSPTPGSSTWPIPDSLQHYLTNNRLFLDYLPGIYQTDETDTGGDHFLGRYLAIFQSFFIPLQWTVANFDQFLHPRSAPPEALRWLADWYGLPFSLDLLPENTQRELLERLPQFLEHKGTLLGLRDLIALCTGVNMYVGIEGKIDVLADGMYIRTLMIEGEIDVLADGMYIRKLSPGDTPTFDEIDDTTRFVVIFADKPTDWETMRAQIVRLIDWFKPAHTTYTLE